jgi:DNA-binding transcriptional LysR family regulator
MELNLLRSLLAVADAGAITEAAQRLGITQPALSRRIVQLEDELGVALLSRGRKGARLTAVGELVASEARALVARYEHLRREVAAYQHLEGGSIRLGGGATAISFVLPAAIASFQAEHPGVRFQVKEAGSAEVADDVAAGRLELGLVTLPNAHRDLAVHPLMDDRIVLICNRGHPLAETRALRLEQLGGLSLVGFEAGSAIRGLIDEALHRAGVQMNVVMELRSIPAILRMVATTSHLAFVSAMAVRRGEDVRLLRPRGLDIRRQLGLVFRKGAVLSPAAAAFAASLRGVT